MTLPLALTVLVSTPPAVLGLAAAATAVALGLARSAAGLMDARSTCDRFRRRR